MKRKHARDNSGNPRLPRRKTLAEILDGGGRKVPAQGAFAADDPLAEQTAWQPRPLAEIVSEDQAEVDVGGTRHGSHYVGKDPYEIIRKMPAVGPDECKHHYPDGNIYRKVCEWFGDWVWADCARACLIDKLPEGLSPEFWGELSDDQIRWLLISHPGVG